MSGSANNRAEAYPSAGRALSLAPEQPLILKRKSDDEINNQFAHVSKKEKNEGADPPRKAEQVGSPVIEADSNCESDYKDLAAATARLLEHMKNRPRKKQPRVQKKPRTWCCQCETTQDFIDSRCHCGHITRYCGICEHFEEEVQELGENVFTN